MTEKPLRETLRPRGEQNEIAAAKGKDKKPTEKKAEVKEDADK